MSHELFEVNAEELRECLIADMSVGLVPMVASSPGLGKSDIIHGIAKEFDGKLIDLRVSQCEPVDMQGYPDTTDDQRMTFRVPEYFPLDTDTLPVKPKSMWASPEVPEYYKGWVLFLDELNSGSKQTEAAAYKLILDKAVYLQKLHPKCLIVAAGNLTTDRAITNTMSTATTSRLTHYRLRNDQPTWLNWANANDVDHRIISLIKFKPELLHRFNVDTAELTFPCPRTWVFASKQIKGKDKIDKLTKVRLAGTIGGGAAVELATYSEIYASLPTIEQILKDPARGWKVPTEPSELFAITTMLSHNTTEKTIEKMVIATERLPMDFQVVTMKDIYKRATALKGHPVIKDWVVKNASAMF